METQPNETALASEEEPTCWCCAGVFAEGDLVRLGAHPEVWLCARCARWAGRRSREQALSGGRGIEARYRELFGTVRSLVLRHDLQNKPMVGRVLRGLDRLLP